MKDNFIQTVENQFNEIYEICMNIHFMQTVLNNFFKLFLACGRMQKSRVE